MAFTSVVGMQRIFIFLSFLEIVTAAAVTTVLDYAPAWSYDDESKWPGRHCQEGGRRQSPIDIKTRDVVPDFAKQFIKYGPLQFTGYHKVLVSGINNGHTIQFSSEGEEAIHPVLTGGPLKHIYRLEQLHFHWLSEHSINGVKYPMELHFVHVRADLSVVEALGKRDGLAIVSVFGNVQAELEDYQQEATDLMQYIPRLMNTGDRISGVILDMTKLMSSNKDTYYTYSGSLTSPECNEAVIWIIMEGPIFFTDAQYRMFGKVGVGRHNFRSLQKLKHHVVFSPADTELHVPQIVVFIGDIIKVFTDFFKNVGEESYKDTDSTCKGLCKKFNINWGWTPTGGSPWLHYRNKVKAPIEYKIELNKNVIK